MIEFAYLYRGLCALARCHQANAMAGHLGATLVAAYLFGEDHAQLDDRVYQAIERDCQGIVRGDEAFWFDPEKAGITIGQLFQPFPDEQPQEDRIDEIAVALSRNIGQLRQSGHNVIFASLAIRALRGHPQFAMPTIVTGIVQLIERFDGERPGRAYFGNEKGWIEGEHLEVIEDAELPQYSDLRAMAEAVVEELIQSGSIRRQGLGGLFHIINHAQALTELDRLGYGELARAGMRAHHRHLCLWRSLPDLSAELGRLRAAKNDPLSVDYWNEAGPSQWSAHLSHRIKTLYGFFSLLRWIDAEDKRREAEKQFRYLMA